jgi:hypothetical protein
MNGRSQGFSNKALVRSPDVAAAVTVDLWLSLAPAQTLVACTLRLQGIPALAAVPRVTDMHGSALLCVLLCLMLAAPLSSGCTQTGEPCNGCSIRVKDSCWLLSTKALWCQSTCMHTCSCIDCLLAGKTAAC